MKNFGGKRKLGHMGLDMAGKYNTGNVGHFTKRLTLVAIICGFCFIAGLLGAPIAKMLFIANGIAFGLSVFLILVPELSVWFLNKFHS
jgi:uncharacterized membrane protein YiaA